MSDSVPAPRSKVHPEPLLLTDREAETLNAAVQRIIRASKPAGQAGLQSKKKKSRR